jgi:hypothetical protein
VLGHHPQQLVYGREVEVAAARLHIVEVDGQPHEVRIGGREQLAEIGVGVALDPLREHGAVAEPDQRSRWKRRGGRFAPKEERADEQDEDARKALEPASGGYLGRCYLMLDTRRRPAWSPYQFVDRLGNASVFDLTGVGREAFKPPTRSNRIEHRPWVSSRPIGCEVAAADRRFRFRVARTSVNHRKGSSRAIWHGRFGCRRR